MESWNSILRGLEALCTGLASTCEDSLDECLEVFDDGDLCKLHDMSPDNLGHVIVLNIAKVISSCHAALQLKERYKDRSYAKFKFT